MVWHLQKWILLSLHRSLEMSITQIKWILLSLRRNKEMSITQIFTAKSNIKFEISVTIKKACVIDISE